MIYNKRIKTYYLLFLVVTSLLLSCKKNKPTIELNPVKSPSKQEVLIKEFTANLEIRFKEICEENLNRTEKLQRIDSLLDKFSNDAKIQVYFLNGEFSGDEYSASQYLNNRIRLLCKYDIKISELELDKNNFITIVKVLEKEL